MSDSETNVLGPEQKRCTIRVLIVADGRIHFREPSPIAGFNLNELIEKALRTGTRSWEDFEITTARRRNDGSNSDLDNCADIPDFTFSDELFGTDKYDQVWMFGDAAEGDGPGEEPPLSESELEVISMFMNAGGGVFATGDHAGLGYAMCGNVPRVRSMRKWCFNGCPCSDLKAPGVDGTRIDTLRTGRDEKFERNDQSDRRPQEIRPKFFIEPSGVSAHPHPLLLEGKSAITVLPDHLHEGECVIPADLKAAIAHGDHPFPEYPEFGATQIRLTPQSVGLAISAGGAADDLGTLLPPVEPRAFSPIVAYDGHQVSINNRQIGRVVVDSSFHHFLDINLRGTNSGDPLKRGYYDDQDNPTHEYQSIKEYYRNIVRYLCPPATRLNYYRTLLLDLLSRPLLADELKPIPNPTYQDYISAGAVTEKALSERYSRAETLQCVLALMSRLPENLRRPLAGLIDPWLPPPFVRIQNLNPADLSHPFFDFEVFVRLFLGVAVLRPPAEWAVGREATQVLPDLLAELGHLTEQGF
jgi:hypothetical protein